MTEINYWAEISAWVQKKAFDVQANLVATQGTAEREIELAIQHYRSATHTSTVLTICAQFEKWLRAAIGLVMRDDLKKKEEKDLFDDYGPFSSFAAKLDLAFALGLITREIYTDLRIIKKIRNDFAHSSEVLYLNSPLIVDRLKKLPGWNEGADPEAFFIGRIGHAVKDLKQAMEPRILARTIKTMRLGAMMP